MNTLTGLTVKILTRAAQVFAWPVILCGINPSGEPTALNVDSSGNLITTAWNPFEFMNLSGTIATGGTAQPASSAKTRNKLVVQNPSTESESLFIDFTGTATTSSFEIQAGQTQVFVAPMDNRALSILAATTGHAFTIWEA
jgi:hypothetical protein